LVADRKKIEKNDEDIEDVPRTYYNAKVPNKDYFGDPIKNVFYVGKLKKGNWEDWGLMTEKSWEQHGRIGRTEADRYEKQSNGKWLKAG
jgi:hypothetical protein